MAIPILSILLALITILLLVTLQAFRLPAAAIRRIAQFVTSVSQGQFSRRTEVWAGGVAEELAKSANVLAEDLDNRHPAQQDKDHLFSILALLDHTNEIALATDNLDTIRLANAAAARMLERSADALLGQHIETVIFHADLRELYRRVFLAQARLHAGGHSDARAARSIARPPPPSSITNPSTAAHFWCCAMSPKSPAPSR